MHYGTAIDFSAESALFQELFEMASRPDFPAAEAEKAVLGLCGLARSYGYGCAARVREAAGTDGEEAPDAGLAFMRELLDDPSGGQYFLDVHNSLAAVLGAASPAAREGLDAPDVEARLLDAFASGRRDCDEAFETGTARKP